MSRELLQQALGALGTSTWDHTRAVGKQELITALRAALAQPEPEPVALMALHDINELMHCNGMSVFVENPRIYPPYCEGEPLVGFVPLYATPPAAPIDGFGGNLDEAFERAGMVMVPREPTEAMCISGDKARHSVVTQARTSAIYRAMIAAAPAPAVPSEAALNTLARLFHNGEEIEGADGAAMMVDMALWHEASEAFDSLIGDGDGETLASSAAPAVREPKHTETSRLLANVADAARRLVEHADFQLGGILSADSKAKDIPSKAVSQVKARHLASLRDRIAELDAAHGIGGGGK